MAKRLQDGDLRTIRSLRCGSMTLAYVTKGVLKLLLLGSGVGTVADGWLPKPQVGSLNPVIDKILYRTYINS